MKKMKRLKSMIWAVGLALLPGVALAEEVECDYSGAVSIQVLRDSERETFQQIDKCFQENTNSCINFPDAREGKKCLGDTYVFQKENDVQTYSGELVGPNIVIWTCDDDSSLRIVCKKT